MHNIPVTVAASGQAGRKQASRLLLILLVSSLVGCGTGGKGKAKDEFFTSGSREADQRATQRMAKEEQLAGSGEGSGNKGAKKAKPESEGAKAAQVEGKLTLYDRLGGEQGIVAIVNDATPRLLEDPRVNWRRKGTKRVNLLHKGETSAWNPTPQNVQQLKNHFTQFLSLATGGPPRYDGKDMKEVHGAMRISNPEFDAAIGDIKASLDKLQIPNKEQKELLAIVESTRPQIVTER